MLEGRIDVNAKSRVNISINKKIIELLELWHPCLKTEKIAKTRVLNKTNKLYNESLRTNMIYNGLSPCKFLRKNIQKIVN